MIGRTHLQLSCPVRQGVPAIRIGRAAVELAVSSVSWHQPPATLWKDQCSLNLLSANRPLSNVMYMLLVRLPILDSSLDNLPFDAQDLITHHLGVRTVVKYGLQKFVTIDHGHSEGVRKNLPIIACSSRKQIGDMDEPRRAVQI